MGGAPSREATVTRYPKPSQQYASNVSVAGALDCSNCVLELGQNLSTSVVTIQRIGDVKKYQQTGEFPVGKGKLLITLDKPFEFRFNGKPFTVSYMTLYRPSPIRIENIQADAVLSLNDYHTQSSHVILVPLSSSNTFGEAGNFVDRIMQSVQGLDEDDKPLAVTVGNDWTINKVLPTTQEKGGKNVVSVPYFRWQTAQLKETLVIDQPWQKVYAWLPPPGEGITTIMLKDPIPISLLTMTYLQLLPYVPSASGAPGASPLYLYKPGKCLTCVNRPTVDPAKLEDLKKKAADSRGVNPIMIVQIAFGIIAGAVALIGIYYGLKWALSGTGQSLGGGVLSAVRWLIMPKEKKPGVAPPAQ